jgi:hypothetical protein
MKRLLAVTLAAMLSFSGYAGAFTSVGTDQYTATVTFTGAGEVSVSVELKDLDTNADESNVNWGDTPSSEITLGVTTWKRAKVYAVLHSTMTDSTGGVQIYTDNENASASPQYTGSGDPCGLVDSDDTTKTLPLCWRITDEPITALNIQQGASGAPDRLWENSLGDDYPCFVWMKDKGTTGFTNGEDYIILKEQDRGIQHAEDTWSTGCASPDYIYFGANFITAVTESGGRTYQTNRLFIEAFTD